MQDKVEAGLPSRVHRLYLKSSETSQVCWVPLSGGSSLKYVGGGGTLRTRVSHMGLRDQTDILSLLDRMDIVLQNAKAISSA